MASYPGAIKTWADKVDLTDFMTAGILNDDVMDEIIAIETELGTDPAGAYATVKARLDDVTGLQNISEIISYGGSDFIQHWVYIPKFTTSDVAGVTFGGFLVGKYESSQPNATASDDNPDVADNTDPGTCPAISQQGVAPWRYVSYIQARKAAANVGAGCHVITAFEWASLAYWAKKHGSYPRGNNANSNPPADQDGGLGMLDLACNARNAGWYCALTGSGPDTWALGGTASGVNDLNGNIWQWAQGIELCPANLNDNSTTPHAITGAGGAGYPLVLADLEIALNTSPYGKSTATAAGSLTDSVKAWTVDDFAACFLYDAAGALYYIDSNTATVLAVDGADTPTGGAYTILKIISTDITAGIVSGNRILTMRETDANLKAFAIPATSDGIGSSVYGNDGYWFDTAVLRAALRGGGWRDGVRAGVCALGVTYAPSYVDYGIGLRVAKSL